MQVVAVLVDELLVVGRRDQLGLRVVAFEQIYPELDDQRVAVDRQPLEQCFAADRDRRFSLPFGLRECAAATIRAAVIRGLRPTTRPFTSAETRVVVVSVSSCTC